MNASIKLKALVASLATVAVVGTALAQGNPPNPAVSNPAQGAGQQSTQTTPMGTTGTPAGSGSTMSGASSTGSGTTMGAGSSTDTSTAATTTTTTKKSKVKAKRKHVARSDRG